MLATTFLAGESAAEQIIARSSLMLGRSWHWVRPLAIRYHRAFTDRVRPRHREVVQFSLGDSGFQRALTQHFEELSVRQWVVETQRMQPLAAASSWKIPPFESVGALADWLGLKIGELEWFADLKGRGCKNAGAKLTHYHYRMLAKDSRSIRLIEAPKPRLKELQREILDRILERIPPHPAAHGFIKGRSIRTFVAPHAAQRVVLRMDLQDFFPSLRGARIQALFRTLGYPESVADLLGGLCTNATPHDAWKATASDINPVYLRDARQLYSRTHLPQGAPTSPSLANLCAYRVDCRLAALAKVVGASYTRYADDLAFSGGELFEKCAERVSTLVAAILMQEGFHVNHRKTRIMRQGVRQHLAGLAVNQHLNVIRTDFDQLKATLTNCVRLGPESQNRSALPYFRLHLEGRVGFVETINPAKGKRLRTICEKIRWG